MSDKTAIEWTDATWNPLVGCTHAGPGCDNCYAATLMQRNMHPDHVGLSVRREDGSVRFTGEIRMRPQLLDQPLRWKRPRRIFVNSLSDLFHRDVPDDFIAQVFAIMAACPQHTFQVLTKRPQRMAQLLGARSSLLSLRGDGPTHFLPLVVRHMAALGVEADQWPLPNVWLGTSIESDRYVFRADHLRATPAAVRWISAEPLLGPLPSLDLTDIDWVVVGGESGPDARPMHPDWARDLRDRCNPRIPLSEVPGSALNDGAAACTEFRRRTGTAFLFKQWGEWFPFGEVDADGLVNMTSHGKKPGHWIDDGPMVRLGKRNAGRMLDGRTWDEYPR